jgi:hypothetical protein
MDQPSAASWWPKSVVGDDEYMPHQPASHVKKSTIRGNIHPLHFPPWPAKVTDIVSLHLNDTQCPVSGPRSTNRNADSTSTRADPKDQRNSNAIGSRIYCRRDLHFSDEALIMARGRVYKTPLALS